MSTRYGSERDPAMDAPAGDPAHPNHPNHPAGNVDRNHDRTSGDITDPTTDRPTGGPPARGHSRIGALWVGLLVATIVLVLLLVFTLQNNQQVSISFLWLSGQIPLGVALLLAAIGGILLVAIPGSIRILQLRRLSRRTR